MQLYPRDIIHVYNRGNNKQQIFFEDRNYHSFLDKIKKHIAPKADILAYCLMPNHFHFLLHLSDVSCKPIKIGSLMSAEINNGFRILLSSYASAINKQFSFTGSLFQQKTKYKLLFRPSENSRTSENYMTACFHYIHQNPLRAGLVNKLEDWKFSSFNEYCAGENVDFCTKKIAYEYLDLDKQNFYVHSYSVIKDEFIDKIF